MSPVNVMVVDDSAVVRRLVTKVLDDEADVRVVGTAHNGRVALEKLASLKPDLVTLDIEMPEMDGLETLLHLRRTHPRLPVIMFSTLTERAAASTLEALARGASDYVTKPTRLSNPAEAIAAVREQILPKIRALVPTGASARGTAAVVPPAAVAATPRVRPAGVPPELLVIGSSTGGPDALASVVRALPATLPVPVVVVQHMPPVFTRMLAQRLDGLGPLTVSEARDGDLLRPGHVLLAPGDHHVEARRDVGGRAHVALTQAPPENHCRPAVDVLFRTAAATHGARTLALVLTGMGQDGLRGAELLTELGAEVWAQDQATSVVWGMPGAVARAGLATRVLPGDQIGREAAAAIVRARARQSAGAPS